MLDTTMPTTARTLVVLSSFVAFAYPANAESQNTCATRAAEISKLISPTAPIRKTAEGALSVGATQIRFVCQRDAAQPAIQFSYPSEYPPDEFYNLLASITARVSHQAAEQMRLRAHRCHRAAKTGSLGRSQKTFDGFRLGCDRHLSRSSFTLMTLPSRAMDKKVPTSPMVPG